MQLDALTIFLFKVCFKSEILEINAYSCALHGPLYTGNYTVRFESICTCEFFKKLKLH